MSSDKVALITPKGKKEMTVLISISAPVIATVTSIFASTALFACIFISIIYNFEESTATHCKVRNYLPSISATIGGFTPQRYIWRICIALHSAPRALFAVIYRNYHLSCKRREMSSTYNLLVNVAFVASVLENMSLISLTFVTSSENYTIHEASFVLFMISSELYMILSCYMFYWARRHRYMNPREKKSLKSKLILMTINILSFLLVLYFFFRHNKYCEPGVYTLFSFFEYVVVISNICFNGFSFSLDMPDIRIYAA